MSGINRRHRARDFVYTPAGMNETLRALCPYEQRLFLPLEDSGSADRRPAFSQGKLHHAARAFHG